MPLVAARYRPRHGEGPLPLEYPLEASPRATKRETRTCTDGERGGGGGGREPPARAAGRLRDDAISSVNLAMHSRVHPCRVSGKCVSHHSLCSLSLSLSLSFSPSLIVKRTYIALERAEADEREKSSSVLRVVLLSYIILSSLS